MFIEEEMHVLRREVRELRTELAAAREDVAFFARYVVAALTHTRRFDQSPPTTDEGIRANEIGSWRDALRWEGDFAEISESLDE